MVKHIFLVFFTLYYTCSGAQDTVYARKVLNELCSPAFKGRGYVGNGDKKAAAYISSQFKSIGLARVHGSYYQKFGFPVNTFPVEPVVKYNGKVLRPGIDYLLDPACPATQFIGTCTFVPASVLNTPNHYDSIGSTLAYVVLDTFNSKYFEEAALNNKQYAGDPRNRLLIRLTSDKLTWSSSPVLAKKCLITLRSEVFDRDKPAEFEIIVKNKFYDEYTSRNVLGMIEGTREKDSFIVFTAHYDHLGMMGNAMFPGANDNASGIAMMLSLAKYFKAHPQKYSLLFIAFSGEENGLIGSKYYVTHPLYPLTGIRFLVNIDLMGNGADGVMAVNGTVFPDEFAMLKRINDKEKYMPAVKVRGKAANSDHYWFSEAGVPCFFFYLMGPYPYYHDINDKASAVPFTNFANAFLLFRDFIVAVQTI